MNIYSLCCIRKDLNINLLIILLVSQSSTRSTRTSSQSGSSPRLSTVISLFFFALAIWFEVSRDNLLSPTAWKERMTLDQVTLLSSIFNIIWQQCILNQAWKRNHTVVLPCHPHFPRKQHQKAEPLRTHKCQYKYDLQSVNRESGKLVKG